MRWQSSSALLLVLSLATAGCATVPAASQESRDLAMSFSPPPGSAGVYVFRASSMFGSADHWDIGLDDKSGGELGNSSYLYFAVAPGNHLIWSVDSGADCGTSFAAENGKNYSFIAFSSTSPVVALKPITENEAKAYAKDFTLSGSCGPEWAHR